MLVISRKINEKIKIGNDIEVTIISIDKNQVKILIIQKVIHLPTSCQQTYYY